MCWWPVSKTHGVTTKEEIFLENCRAAVTMQWQNQLFRGPTQKFKKALNVADKICGKECIIWLHAPCALSGGSSLERRPDMLHFHAQFPGLFQRSPSDNVYIERSRSTTGCAYHVKVTQPWRLWCHPEVLTALHTRLADGQRETID